MTHKSLNLGKLLKFFELGEAGLQSALRAELRAEREKLIGIEEAGGGDFHVPFWADAKRHIMGLGDLSSMVDARVTASKQRKRLYPQLCEGFLRWLDDLQRTTNRRVGFEPINAHNHFDMAHINLTLKVDNLLCLKLGEDNFRLVYPYFTENPLLSLKWARVGIWAMGEALQKYSSTDMEILDVLRGRAFRGLSISLKGDEEALFVGRYREILQKWDVLRLEYGV